MSIYDRSQWPVPDDNPLIKLITGPDDWIANGELAAALELVNTTRSKSVVGHYRAVLDELGESETRVEERHVGKTQRRQQVRVFSRKAAVLIAMRARTLNAVAFRDWLASRAALGALQTS